MPTWPGILWMLTSVVSNVVTYYVCIHPSQSVCISWFRSRLALILEVSLLTGCVFPLFSPTEYVVRQSPTHHGCPPTSNHCKQHYLSKWGPVGFGHTQRVRPRWEGHGQRLPGPHLHPLLHGVLASVSFVFKTRCSCAQPSSPAQPVCCLVCAGSTTVPARRATWTAPSPSGSCCCGWAATPATWWAPSWQTSSLCRWAFLWFPDKTSSYFPMMQLSYLPIIMNQWTCVSLCYNAKQ